ncbi:pyridoxamine 5'-phosphate oxidase family protein [Kribbella sp. NPDC050124]|uniref:pyridoxamine 5'-phosphate oxidase family protein n=1 Tax=Kribbella sp. NPDC050124 TaxID=3364114 RepID=UPI00379A9030
MHTTRQFDRTGLEILDPAECLRLLQSMPVGRLVFTQRGLPAIRLVNFSVDGDTIVFASDDGEKFRAAVRGDVVAFEVDDVDLDRHVGWTVTCIGHLSVVPADEAARLRRVTPLRPWAPLHERRMVRLRAEELSGRRLLPWGQRPRAG